MGFISLSAGSLPPLRSSFFSSFHSFLPHFLSLDTLQAAFGEQRRARDPLPALIMCWNKATGRPHVVVCDGCAHIRICWSLWVHMQATCVSVLLFVLMPRIVSFVGDLIFFFFSLNFPLKILLWHIISPRYKGNLSKLKLKGQKGGRRAGHQRGGGGSCQLSEH